MNFDQILDNKNYYIQFLKIIYYKINAILINCTRNNDDITGTAYTENIIKIDGLQYIIVN